MEQWIKILEAGAVPPVGLVPIYQPSRNNTVLQYRNLVLFRVVVTHGEASSRREF